MATLTEAMDAIEAEFAALKAVDDLVGAVDLHGAITAWLNEQLAEVYQKSIGANTVGVAADVATHRANVNSVIA